MYFRFYGILLFLMVLSGCSNHQLPFKDFDAIIAQLERDHRQEHGSVTILERPENSVPFQASSGFVSSVGGELNGSFGYNEIKIPFRYPKVEGKYYVVTPLTDKSGKISLLITLHPGTPASHDEPSEPTISAAP